METSFQIHALSILGGDNLCSIYDVRPKACREFPHTDRKKIHQINHLTIKNTLTCPAAYLFVEKLRISCRDLRIKKFLIITRDMKGVLLFLDQKQKRS